MFHLVSTEDDEVAAEGIECSNGMVIISWMTAMHSISMFPNMRQFEAMHTHGGRATVKILQQMIVTPLLMPPIQEEQKCPVCEEEGTFKIASEFGQEPKIVCKSCHTSFGFIMKMQRIREDEHGKE